MTVKTMISGSFRDPSGFLYASDGMLLRQINTRYAEHYDHFLDSGLYKGLVDAACIIPHGIEGSLAIKSRRVCSLRLRNRPSVAA